jgi:hypothetical protein
MHVIFLEWSSAFVSGQVILHFSNRQEEGGGLEPLVNDAQAEM